MNNTQGQAPADITGAGKEFAVSEPLVSNPD